MEKKIGAQSTTNSLTQQETAYYFIQRAAAAEKITRNPDGTATVVFSHGPAGTALQEDLDGVMRQGKFPIHESRLA